MRNIFKRFSNKRYNLPKSEQADRIYSSFSPAEKAIFYAFAGLLILGSLSLFLKANGMFLSNQPSYGGSLTEGIVGSPRFINPLLALSDADRDLTSLVYSGLLKATPDGTLKPDLAERYEITEDGLQYTFYIRENARFHDGVYVTADDVIFTIQKAQDSALKSSKRANWEGVMAEKISDREVRLTLNKPYSPFLENATLGILPKHIWKDADSDQFAFSPYNIEAIGSGPYKIASIKRNNSGIPMYYELKSNPRYSLGTPYIKTISFRFYPNEKELVSALKRGDVESISSLTPQSAKELKENGIRIARTALPRVFGVFFNQNHAPILAEKEVREALDLVLDKENLVKQVLEGYGVPISDPVPPVLFLNTAEPSLSMEQRVATAEKLLDQAKWKMNETTGIRERTKGKSTETLAFSLVTSKVPELEKSAELIAEEWKKLGVNVKLQVFEGGDLNQTVIRPRKYDSLLFGEIIGRDLDLFAFWHSSQRNDPGLNIALYTNSKVDKLLEETRKTSDADLREENYAKILENIRKDAPAVFLYSPEFIYVIPKKVKGFELKRITVPSERFLSVHEWYIETESVWNIFQN